MGVAARTGRWRAAALAALAGVALAGCQMLGDRIERGGIRNVVVITMDTTRADRIHVYGNADIETPNIDTLAAGGVLFETAITSVPLTVPSHTSIFSGLYPTHHGVRNNGTFKVPDKVDTMAELLRRQGFHTAAVIGAFVLDSKFGLDQGFQTYDDNLHAGKKGPMFMFDERPGRMVTDRGLAWLAEHEEEDERFFLWLHYFDPHANYEPPPPFDVLYDGRPYDGEIAGVDAEIGRVVAALRDDGRLEDTLIVLTSDHGESLGEHGERTHSLLLYDATLRVPLIVSHPALPQGTRVRGQVRTVDILPTVLDLLGLSIPSGLDGESLTPLMNGDHTADRAGYIETLVPYFNNGWAELRGVRDSAHKYVRAPRAELYDLQEDRGETNNLLDREPDVAARLAEQLDRFLATDVMRTGGDETATLQLSAADRERLGALGYEVGDHGHLDPSALPDPKDKILLWEEFQVAQNLMRENKLDEAIPALRAVLDSDPGNIMARSSLGNALLAQGRSEEAKEEYERTIALDPRRNQGRISLARIYRREGNVTAAFDTLKEALANDRNAPELANEFADFFQETGNIDKAIEWYEEALRRDPLYTKALIGLSNTYHRAQRDTDARAVLERCLEIDPRNADALYNLGVVLEGEGKDEEALARYRRVLEIEPNHLPALNNLGSYYDRKGETSRAVVTYRRILELNDKHFEANYNLGTLLLRSKRYDEAVPLLERALELNPRHASVYNNLAMSYLELERYDDAIALLRKIAAADPKNATWWLRLARAEMKAGHGADAKQHFERAIEVGGEGLRGRIADDPVLGDLARGEP